MHYYFIAMATLISFYALSNSYAVDYNAEALEMHNNINTNSIFTEESVQENLDSYVGSNINEASYYNDDSKLDIDAQVNLSNDESASIASDSYLNSPDYSIDLNEDWLQNAQEVTSNPYQTLGVVTSTYSDCSSNVRSCTFYQNINTEPCFASRIVEVDNYHKYQCNKNRNLYDIDCTQNLNVSCASSQYTFPPVKSNNFPRFAFNGTTLELDVPRRGANCNGANYELKFTIPSPDVVSSFILKSINFDDKVKVFINGNLVYEPIKSNQCELERYWQKSPNLNLKNHLVSGTNSIKIVLIIGGLGNLDSTFEFKYKECQTYSENQWSTFCGDQKFLADSCSQISKICTDSNKTKNIGKGVSEYRSCWKYSIIKQCTPSEYDNYCESLENNDSCNQLSSTCVTEGEDYCVEYNNLHRCSNDNISLIDSQLTYLGYFQDILTDYVNYDECTQFDQSNYCSLVDETCSSVGLKQVNGLLLERDCWKYKRSYRCANESVDQSDCTELEYKCTFESSECLQTEESGVCSEYKRNYQCSNTGIIEDKDADIVVCNSQVYCEGEECDEIIYEKNTDIAKAAAYASVIEQAADDLDDSTSITFAGTDTRCSKDIVNFSDCCSMDGWSGDFTDIVANALVGNPIDLDELCPSGDCELGNIASGILNAGITTPLIGSISNIAATELSNSFDFCSTSEKNLYMSKQNSQCVYVGRYCSTEESLTGLCLEEKETYCCYNSKIATIIHAQGRPQIGKGWGTPENPQCNGLSVDDLENINFDEIDFSSVASEIEANAITNLPNNDNLKGTVSENIQQYFLTSEEGNE